MSNIKNPQSNPLKSSAPVRPPGGDTTPKKVYVCSPFRPTAVSLTDRAEEQRSNIERALKACRILAMMGIQPLAPHLYFTRFLKDDVAAERAAGMQFGLSWLEQADELWVFGDTVSEGMAQEIAKAKELGKPAVFINKVVINDMDLRKPIIRPFSRSPSPSRTLISRRSRTRLPLLRPKPTSRWRSPMQRRRHRRPPLLQMHRPRQTARLQKACRSL